VILLIFVIKIHEDRKTYIFSNKGAQ